MASDRAVLVTLVDWLATHGRASSVAAAYANYIYRLASCDPSDPPGAPTLLWCLFGEDCAAWGPDAKDAKDPQILFHADGGWQVIVPRSFDGVQLNIALHRALARWFVMSRFLHVEEKTILEIAAALALPDSSLPIAQQKYGTPDEVAAYMALPKSIVVQRLAALSKERLAKAKRPRRRLTPRERLDRNVRARMRKENADALR